MEASMTNLTLALATLRLTAAACFGLAMFLSAQRRSGAATIWGMTGTLAAGAAVGLVLWLEGRPPLFGVYEGVMNVALLLGFGTLLAERISRARLGWRPWLTAATILLLSLPAQAGAEPDYYMYDYVFTMIFFQSRIVVMALLLLAVCFYWTALDLNHNKHAYCFWLSHQGRNLLLLSGVFFLVGEFSGCIWALNGWGDSWQWSRGFFQSAAMFMGLMAGCHVPRRWTASPHNRAKAGVIACLFVLLVYAVNQALEMA